MDTGIPVGSSPNAQLLKSKFIQERKVLTGTNSKPKDKVRTAKNSTNKESPDNSVEDLNPIGADATVSKDAKHQKQKKGKTQRSPTTIALLNLKTVLLQQQNKQLTTQKARNLRF